MTMLRLFLFFLLLSILILFTPLTLKYNWLTNCIYFLTIILSFFVGGLIKNKRAKVFITYFPLLGFLFILFTSFLFSPLGNQFTSGWKTSWIEYRNVKHPENYIAQQMMDVGARGYKRRFVKVVPLIPLFSWTTIADTSALGNNWIKVNEDLNPFDLK